MEFFTRVITAIASGSGFAALDWKAALMLFIACVLLYMGIGKGFEPLLLVPIAFGMLLANLPITGLMNEPVYDAATHSGTVGFMWTLYQGVQYAISVHHLYGHRGYDRLRPPAGQPRVPAAGRRRSAGHLRRLPDGPGAGL